MKIKRSASMQNIFAGIQNIFHHLVSLICLTNLVGDLGFDNIYRIGRSAEWGAVTVVGNVKRCRHKDEGIDSLAS